MIVKSAVISCAFYRSYLNDVDETQKSSSAAILSPSRARAGRFKEDVGSPERSGRRRSVSGLPPGATNYITARGICVMNCRSFARKMPATNALSR
jgi:hypothetical protein